MPFQAWSCDVCKKPIPTGNLDIGMVVWRETDGRGYHDFKIVHKNIEGYHCDPGSGRGYTNNLPIDYFLGPEGMGELLSWLSASPIGNQPVGVESIDEFMELFRRLQMPHYEEARPHFNDQTRSWIADNAVDPDRPDTLEKIARLGDQLS